MQVDHLRRPAVQLADADLGGDPGQGGKAFRVIRPILAIGPKVDIAGAVIKARRIKDQQVETLHLCRQQSRLAAEQVGGRPDL